MFSFSHFFRLRYLVAWLRLNARFPLGARASHPLEWRPGWPRSQENGRVSERLRLRFSFGIAVLVIGCALLSACSSMIQPISSGKPLVDYRSSVSQMLRKLPPPPEPIVVGVYKFRDQTGQYKSSDTLVQYSTAVTQGGTPMLIRALLEAGNGKWFTVLERESLPNLMNERKIIRQTREQYLGEKEGKPQPEEGAVQHFLPPMLYAPILLDGGIIAYETNLLTGGVGARYFGAGGSLEFRRDAVTSMLRSISVKNGQILNQVDARKTIFSADLESGLYRYISYNKLLEVEAGITSNEPPQMAVMESIESCVYALIMEGLISHAWSLANPAEVQPLIEQYLKDRDSKMVAQFDSHGNVVSVVPGPK